jgi:hypothetical protein
MDARRRELVLEDPGGPREGCVHVAVRLDDVPLMVGVRHGWPHAPTFQESVRRGVRVQRRRIGTQCVVHLQKRRELLVLDRDQADRFVGDLTCIRRHRGHAIADKKDTVPTEERPVLQPPAQALAADVRTGKHGAHSGERARATGVDRHNPRVRIGAAHECRLQRARNV